MRKIGVISVGRSDYGIYRPLLRKIQSDSQLQLQMIVAGMHLLEKYGSTVKEIERDGFSIAEKISFPLEDDSPTGVAVASGEALKGFAKCYERLKPDMLLVLGDRFEMHAAALAALPFKIPVAHIHGGELTLGAIDNALRHSITLLSHLHFAATEIYRQRIIQLGEEPWRVHCTGALAVDEINSCRRYTLKEISEKFDLPLERKPILVTFHPVTLEFEKTEWQMDQLLSALAEVPHPIVFTGTNADTQNTIIWQKIRSFISKHNNAHLVVNFGPDYYFSMLENSLAMVGNSSSGLIETPSFELPAVNIGTRQEGRVRAKNVIDVGYAKEEILKGIQKALSKEFREGLRGMVSPYGNGKAAEQILPILKTAPLGPELIFKRFVDV